MILQCWSRWYIRWSRFVWWGRHRAQFGRWDGKNFQSLCMLGHWGGAHGPAVQIPVRAQTPRTYNAKCTSLVGSSLRRYDRDKLKTNPCACEGKPQASYQPVQVLLSLCIVKASFGHAHSYEPRVLKQTWLQPPLLLEHSSISVEKYFPS